MAAWLSALLVIILASPAWAQLALPSGFTAQVYVTGQGFDSNSERGVLGMPAVASLAFDGLGSLYLSKTGARFRQGEVEDLFSVYRIPLGGARLNPDTEPRYFYGPPLRNPIIAAVRGRGEVYVTTYDRDRRTGALYRMADGRPQFLAGGTPAGGGAPLFRQPEGVAVDGTGRIYVADRELGLVARLDPTGRVLDEHYLTVTRPRVLAMDEQGQLWVGTDGTAETPFQDGKGELWKVGLDGSPALVLTGPLPAGLSVSPSGTLFFAQRRTAKVFVVTADGKRIDFASGGDGTYVRGLAFAPVTPETRRAGIAGDLFVVAVARQVWAINEILRISGPFDEFVRQQSSQQPPQ
jgi:sugar lactone lactonase YvrE